MLGTSLQKHLHWQALWMVSGTSIWCCWQADLVSMSFLTAEGLILYFFYRSSKENQCSTEQNETCIGLLHSRLGSCTASLSSFPVVAGLKFSEMYQLAKLDIIKVNRQVMHQHPEGPYSGKVPLTGSGKGAEQCGFIGLGRHETPSSISGSTPWAHGTLVCI